MNNLVFIEPNKIGAVPEGTKVVYVFESDTGLTKIGVTSNYIKRKRTLETQSGFRINREYVSTPFANYSEIERLSHKKLESMRVLGEWFHASFDTAVCVVQELCDSLGDANNPEKREVSSEPLFRLPTAMEELSVEEPELCEWLVLMNYEAYYTNGSQSLRVRGVDFDLDFNLFAQITLVRAKQ
jgi:hypothetical protein